MALKAEGLLNSIANPELPDSSQFRQEMAVPVIDFSKLQGEERAATMARIDNACEQWGFFQLLNHGIPLELLDRVKRVCDKCFKMSREEGFKDSRPVRLLKELIDGGETDKRLNDIDWEDVFFLQDDNQWPSTPLDFKETMTEYRAELKKLAEKVMEVMDENLGLEKGYIKMAFSGGSEGNYRPFLGTKDDRVGGLQVLKEGRWFDVRPLAGAIVINTGDQIEVLSNGRYQSAWHRVVASGNGNRRSVASFYNPALKAVIKPPEGPAAEYPSFLFGDYMAVYAKQKFMAKEPRFLAAAAM
ncbi:hypothetical protein HPP92_004030 [Vanilla planifolia]|uniref:Uncharacterized protein n=1 Tax=Vanilla planifolia TaxID=51239 RepID=A0A835RWC7_VANPL|nr:hypothetical protein HPP92_004451 [Vanilla planifolia]KAG0503958.1 hypothetical protein HPP92_004030 [Vanilla planifolia]